MCVSVCVRARARVCTYTGYYICFSLLFAKTLKLLFFFVLYKVYMLVLKTFMFRFLTILVDFWSLPVGLHL